MILSRSWQIGVVFYNREHRQRMIGTVWPRLYEWTMGCRSWVIRRKLSGYIKSALYVFLSNPTDGNNLDVVSRHRGWTFICNLEVYPSSSTTWNKIVSSWWISNIPAEFCWTVWAQFYKILIWNTRYLNKTNVTQAKHRSVEYVGYFLNVSNSVWLCMTVWTKRIWYSGILPYERQYP